MEETKEKISRRHIRVPDDVWEGMAVLAKDDGRSINNYLVEVVLRPHVVSRPYSVLMTRGEEDGTFGRLIPAGQVEKSPIKSGGN